MLASILCATLMASYQGTVAPKPAPITVKMELDPRGMDMDAMKKNMMGYMPSSVTLVEDKPAGIVKEPSYAGKPKYGAFRLGNGPKAVTFFALDEPKDGAGHLYIDVNQDGDLTNDGPTDWDHAKAYDGIMNYDKTIALHASWGGPLAEDEGGYYTLFMYKRHGDSRLGFTKFTTRMGKIEIGGKPHTIMVAENDSDAQFIVTRRMDRSRRPVQLFIDLNDDGLFTGYSNTVGGKKLMVPERFMADQPFQVDGNWYEAYPSLSGAELTLMPSAAPGQTSAAPQAVVESKPLLAAGTKAPDFKVLSPDGRTLKLSDFKGQIVLLDFWATWCGPCKESMPGLEAIYKQVKSQGVVVFSVNVFDDKDPFDAWIKQNSGTVYSFTFGFDQAGHDLKKSVASSMYNVEGIPTLYVIDRDGTIKRSIVGSGNEKNIVKALGDLGVKANP